MQLHPSYSRFYYVLDISEFLIKVWKEEENVFTEILCHKFSGGEHYMQNNHCIITIWHYLLRRIVWCSLNNKKLDLRLNISILFLEICRVCYNHQKIQRTNVYVCNCFIHLTITKKFRWKQKLKATKIQNAKKEKTCLLPTFLWTFFHCSFRVKTSKLSKLSKLRDLSKMSKW
jgi:hypothetical protein